MPEQARHWPSRGTRAWTAGISQIAQGYIEIRALGPLSVALVEPNGTRKETSAQAWRHGRARTLLALLLARPNLQLTRDAAIESLWPDASLSTGSRHLSNALWNLRKALATLAPQAPLCIQTTQGMISLRASAAIPPDMGSCWLDVLAFEAACQETRLAAAGGGALRAARSALGRYPDHFLTDLLSESWADGRRERLRLQWIESAFQVAAMELTGGRPHAALDPLLMVLEDTPDHVDAACAAMRVLARMGRPQDALSLHDRVRGECFRAEQVYPEALRQAALEVRTRVRTDGMTSGGRWVPPLGVSGSHMHAAHRIRET